MIPDTLIWIFHTINQKINGRGLTILVSIFCFFSFVALIPSNSNSLFQGQYSPSQLLETESSEYQAIPNSVEQQHDSLLDFDFASLADTVQPVQSSNSVVKTSQAQNTTESAEVFDEDFEHRNVAVEYTPDSIIPPKPLTASTPDVSAVTNILLGFQGITGITPGATNVPPNQSFTVTLDENANNRIFSSFTFFPEAQFSYTIDGNSMTVSPHRLKRNTDYVFGASFANLCRFDNAEDCSNANDTTTEYKYSVAFRTDWKEKYTYGKSVLGRDLDAYIFGFGDKSGKVIMLTGGIHGTEWRAGDLTQLKDYLWNRPEELAGQNKTIIIIPFMNPDGTLTNNRYNARGVNLNRNFPAYWQPCPQCGRAGYSEPESFFWGEFAQREGVTHLISYHAQWPPFGIIFKGADGSQKIDEFAIWVSNRTGYPVGYYSGVEINNPNSVVPGDQTVWAAAWDVTSILIEATYLQNSDWDKNFPMYLDLIRTY